jgi:hypothetical protein
VTSTRFIAGALLGLLATVLGIWAWGNNDEALGLAAICIGAVAIALAASGPWGWTGACVGLGAFLILLAVYLPALGAEATVKAWFGEGDAGAADRADAVTFARWTLIVAGVLFIAWPGRSLLLETSLALVALLAIVAAIAATITLVDRVTTTDAKDPTQADARRGFVLPADQRDRRRHCRPGERADVHEQHLHRASACGTGGRQAGRRGHRRARPRPHRSEDKQEVRDRPDLRKVRLPAWLLTPPPEFTTHAC